MSFEVVIVKSINVQSPRLKLVISIKHKEHFSTKLDKVIVSLEKGFEWFINTLPVVTPRLSNLMINKCIISILINN